MNRAFSRVLQTVFVALLAVSSQAYAAEEKKAVVKADPAKGEALYTNGDNARNIVACVSCHGAAGNSTITQNPKLAGQHEAYIAKQLMNFRTPERNNPVMSPLAKALSDEDIKNVAAYLAAQSPKPGAAKNKDTLELGKHIWRGGIASKNVPACAGCHSPNGAGIPAQYPRLAGQHQDYTVAELTNFRGGSRNNSPQMTAIAERLSDKEIKAVADYIAGLK
ncbi:MULTISPECIES: cytochrome c [unclassified Herbaspirillum]|uniref:c-type cytochrome n=1 Tax=unclassified Herbaspirillum TaxID=2624150 RepID=UPI0011534257|nr:MULTISPECIES: c-type cytochrome [unclassified Herbaspirillum]MBB5393692.1 cbb3-type cytochrome c oxidase subunit III [Herbaspirillum sp. SJZ102]TQK01446.1 cbb3-type cytochrome c oxidase subunit III [Herbaspirillum sp. SJZ130]TQK05842.1 cbb3-type cytochrome c oxidase subunit III [Herbaspirillum sp. SJZ106]TWC65215.1 cbb3-type cytochrome c oxidase subunit III [Herbaspirillum sp. SJZ099]